MATLSVTQSGTTDFRGGAAETNIDQIVFQTPGPGGATAIFEPAQFGPGLISNSVTITGDAFADAIVVSFAAAATFSAAGWQFANWTNGVDTITFQGSSGDDRITGSAQSDSVAAGDGDDDLSGGGGADTLDGGDGVDLASYFDKTAAVVVTLNGSTNATVTVGGVAEDTLRNIEQVYGGSAGDTLTGDGVANTLRGGGGADTLDGGGGTDTADYRDKTAAIVVTLNGSTNATVTVGGVAEDTIRNIENVSGGSGNDTLKGDGAANLLDGNGGNDTLYGGGGIDTLRGGTGDDTYVMRSSPDAIVEFAGQGADRVISSESFVLNSAQEIENLFLTGSADIDGTGNGLNNGLGGNSGNNVLDGGPGADSMSGGAGNDTYVVDDFSDKISESSGGGTDLVLSPFSIPLGQFVENQTLTGSGDGNAFGNSLDNTLIGNSGNNTLSGGGGKDTLDGGGGVDTADYSEKTAAVVVTLAGGSNAIVTVGGVAEDTIRNIENIKGGKAGDTLTGDGFANLLDGSFDADTMQGGAGNDTYIVDNAGDKVIEADGEGIDLVESSVSFSMRGQYIENLTLTDTFGEPNTNVTGNSLDNTIIGNDDNNLFDGGVGDDTLQGKYGTDTLNGGTGADTFLFDTTLNVIANVDHITDFAAVDTINLENDDIFTALTTNGTLAASAFYSAAGATSAHDSTDRIVYNTMTGALFYDADGVGGTAAIQFAVLDNHTAITNADFVVI
jgi:Ca2+-binding RTX toxin-like protein